MYNETSILRPKEPTDIVTPEGKDKFGIDEIYPTKNGGREWYVNMDNPLDDNLFQITSNLPISNNIDDDSWAIDGSSIRMNVNTPSGEPQWKNIEMTGYVKINSVENNNNSDNSNQDDNNNGESDSPGITWRARGGFHNNNSPCEGTALNGAIDILEREAEWKKEIWHTGGYTDARGNTLISDNSLIGKWIGWKVIMYNINDDSAVKMETYIDENEDNQWRKVNEVIDDGGWFANSSDEEFNSAGCDKPKDYIITNGGDIATFRADNIAMDFKNLSIREIQAA